MASLIHQVPGFRSGRRWKKSIAVVGYALIALFVLTGVLGGNGAAAIMGLEALAFVLLAANAWGLRSHIPLLNSSNKLAATGGWAIAVVVALMLLGAVSPSSPKTADNAPSSPGGTGPGTGQASPGAPVAAAKPTLAPPKATSVPPTPTPPVPTATPAPPTATASPDTQLAQAAQKQFGSKLRQAKLSPISMGKVTEVYANVDYDLGAQWDEGSAVRAMANDLKGFGSKVFAVGGVDALELRAFTEFKDAYGNSKSDVAMKFTVTKGTAAKINWQNVNPRNFGVILTGDAGGVYVHPALRSAWNDYLAGK